MGGRKMLETGFRKLICSVAFRRTAFWFAVIFVSWKIIFSKAFMGSLILFLTVGEIPGFDKVLSPEQVMQVTCGCFALAFMLVFN